MSERPVVICIGCGKPFLHPYGHGKRVAKYCSKDCFQNTGFKRAVEKGQETLRAFFASGQRYSHQTPIRNKRCRHCDAIINKQPSKAGQFCNRDCHNQYRRGKPVISGPRRPRPGGTLRWQREYARRVFKNTCNRCGYNKVPGILQVHHRDHNPRNPAPGNLELICPNCHEEDHFATKTGRFSPLPRRKKSDQTYKAEKSVGVHRLQQQMKLRI